MCRYSTSIFSLISCLSDSSEPESSNEFVMAAFPFFYGGDDIGAAHPVGFRKVGLRPLRRMVGMRVVETDDILAALAAFALNADEFLGIDVVAVMGGVGAGVAATRGAGDDARSIVIEASQKNAAAFVRIGFFAVVTKSVVLRCVKL